jgi:hypothetical protein
MQLYIVFPCSTNVPKLCNYLRGTFYEDFCIMKLAALLCAEDTAPS